MTWNTNCLQIGFPGSDCPDASGIFADRFAANNPADLSTRRWALAGYLGYQWQISALVLGLEGDLKFINAQRTLPGIPGAEDPSLALGGSFDSASVATKWDASMRVRGGFLLMPGLLAYATGGPSWLKASASITCGSEFPTGWCSAANVGVTESTSAILRGWTWGGGVEAMLSANILLRGEYRIARYGALEHTFLEGVLNNADAFSTRTTVDTQTLMVGLGYKF